VIAEHLGLHFPPERWPDLERGIGRAARETGVLAYVQDLLSSPPDREVLDTLAVHLTVGETYFFREKPIFEALQQRILPELIGERRATTRHLRLWSAGCASGEEP
jgi:chemotaxis protein methyltransferase CheR